MKGLTVAVALWAGLAQAVSAQGVLGAPPATGISFQTPPTTPPPNPPSPVTPIRPAPPSTPPRDGARPGPYTDAPLFDRDGRTPRANPQSPVTPIRPAPPSTPPRDLFRAGPFTYAPLLDRDGRTPIYGYGGGYYGGGGGYGTFPEPVIERHFFLIPVTDAGSASPASAAPVETPPKPGHRGPLYVIGNCYLGDSPPDPDRLPKGCVPSRARQLRQR